MVTKNLGHASLLLAHVRLAQVHQAFSLRQYSLNIRTLGPIQQSSNILGGGCHHKAVQPQLTLGATHLKTIIKLVLYQ